MLFLTTWLLPIFKKQVVLPVLGQKTLELVVIIGNYIISLLIFLHHLILNDYLILFLKNLKQIKMNADLNRLVENWKEVVDKPEVARAFVYKNSQGDTLPAKSYTIDSSQVVQLLGTEKLINIRIIMGCNKKDLTVIRETPIFTPIIGGIGSGGEEQYFAMSFDFNSNIIGFDDPIPVGKAKDYVSDWSEYLKLNKMDGVFKIPKGEKFQTLEHYTFHDVDTRLIKDFSNQGEGVSLFFHLGLEPSPTKKYPFKFRTVLKVSKEVGGSKQNKFYQLSSPCPPNCDRIICRSNEF